MARIYGAVREFDPMPAQVTALRSNVGAVRKAQNTMLDNVKQKLDAKESISWTPISLHTEWRNIREEKAPWYEECSKEAFQDGCSRLSSALKNWSDSRKGKRKGKKVEFPKFRKRGTRDSWSFTAGRMVTDSVVKIPRVGHVALKEPLHIPEGSRVTMWTVRERAGRWFLTVRIREDSWTKPEKKPTAYVVGIDLGVGDDFATFPDRSKIKNPRFLKQDHKRLRKAHKAVSRKPRPKNPKDTSKRREEAVQRLQRVYFDVTNRRQDFLHKLTTDLVKSHDVIVLEDLNNAGMARKKGFRLGKSVSDACLREFRRQVEYKSEWYGTTVIIADRWFPSSKLCSTPGCGYKNQDLELKELEWTCPECGRTHDRNVNASRNLTGYGERLLAGSFPVLPGIPGMARGDGARPPLVAVVGETGMEARDVGLLASVSRK